MAANPSITVPNLIPDTQQAETRPKPMGLLQRIEAFLDTAFGDDEETIANSLRGL